MARLTSVVPNRIDPNIRDKASLVLAEMGLTVSDAMLIALTRTAGRKTLSRRARVLHTAPQWP